MRIRFFKPRSTRDRFAWLPKQMSNGTWVWLEPYRRIPHGFGYNRKGRA
jgi:hypothetical protein